MKNIVTTDWLSKNLEREEILIMDTRSVLGDPDYGARSYKEGHLPGAVFVSVEEVLTGELSEHGGRHPLPDIDKFAKDMENLGVDDLTEVIVYDDGDLGMAARLWWMLKLVGKENVKILGGGIKGWKEKGLELTTDIPETKKSRGLTVKKADGLEISMQDVKELIGKDKAVIVDTRTAERYRGENEPIDKVAGHIPSAVNYPWTDLTEGSRIPEKDELEKYFEDLRGYDKIVVHCGSGIACTVNFLFMEEIGLKPVAYIGSWSDWISYDDNEIVVETK
ncbi:MAG: sulfurtransferase [Gudongella sp.]|nr:sulfurtransferase [Gudongella sp.]